MSEFYLNYYEVNQSKNQLIHAGKILDNLGSQLKSVAGSLNRQNGLGIENYVLRLNRLAERCERVAENLSDEGNFLYVLLEQTEQGDHKAKKYLESFSVRKAESIWDGLRSALEAILSLLFSWTGGKFSGNPVVKWASALFGSFAQGIDEDSAGEAAMETGKDLLGAVAGEGLEMGLGMGSAASGLLAGWIVDLLGDAVENFTDGEGDTGDDFFETAMEGVAELLLYGIAGAGAAAVIAAVGLSGGAAAVAVGAMVMIVKWAADYASEKQFHNEEGFVENFGDSICGWKEQYFG